MTHVHVKKKVNVRSQFWSNKFVVLLMANNASETELST